jgi:predicted RecB family nuclease
MRIIDGEFSYSPTDLVRFFESEFASFMDHYEKVLDKATKTEEGVHRNPKDPLYELIAKMGDDHEGKVLEELKTKHKVVLIDKSPDKRKEAISKTLDAMKAGADFIYQAALKTDKAFGYADILRKIPGKSNFGNYLYIAEDIKIATHPKPGAIIQLCTYSDMLHSIQGSLPQYFSIITKGQEYHDFSTSSFVDFFYHLKTQFLAYHDTFDAKKMPIPEVSADHKDWTIFAKKILHQLDDISLTARIRSAHIELLRNEEGIHTITALSKFKKDKVKGIPKSTLEILKDQASLQIESRGKETPLFKVLEHNGARTGLEMLPPSNKADVFFDMEGYPLLDEGGIEYLYGNCTNEKDDYVSFWAYNKGQEGKALNDWVKWVYERWKKNPKMHIYHYGHYETSTIQRLMGDYGIGEFEIDNLLRNDVFVDLNRVVVQSLRIGTFSYSLKEVEKLYYPKRETKVSSGADAAVQFFHFLNSDSRDRESPFLKEIEKYNYDDCLSTKELYEFLVRLQKKNKIKYIPKTEEPPGEVEIKQGVRGECQLKAAEMLDMVPVDKRGLHLSETTEGLYLTELLAHLLEFHIREDKPGWWDYFSRFDMDTEEKFQDPYTIASCELEREDSTHWHICFEPEQEVRFDTGDKVLFLENENSRENYEITEIDLIAGKAKIRKPGTGSIPTTTKFTIAPEKNDFYKINIFKSLLKTANEFGAGKKNYGLKKCIQELLLRKHPDISGHKGSLISKQDNLIQESKQNSLKLNESILCFQGPPGCGKTYTAAHIILELIKKGKRVGITANSHKAILNVILKIFEEKEFELVINIEKVTRDENLEDEQNFLEDLPVQFVDSNQVSPEAQIVGGTTFFFSRADQEESYDYLFVDEASQVSLANLVAASRATQNIILIGDQNQLDQPIQGSHPGESGQSALSYYTDGATTIPEDKGVFLPESHRMNPQVCQFISDSFYEGKLNSHEKTEKQVINLTEDLNKLLPTHGVHYIPVEHAGNMHSSPEEVSKIKELYEALQKCTWVSSNGKTNPITEKDIIIVAPYNLQVAQIRRALGPNARAASVDKFQGQEAPISILSLGASTIKDAPRGIGFIFNKNRMNVAISRAKCLSIIVGSNKLLETHLSSIQSVELMNIWCKITKPQTPRE